MKSLSALTHWLESRWVNPAYGGWLLLAIAIFFFGAGTNTLAGWLYVLSGVILALLAVNAVMAVRALQGIEIQRGAIEPVTAGEPLSLVLTLHNRTQQPKALLQIVDHLPFVLSKPLKTVVPVLPAAGQWQWQVDQPTQRRGVYQWQRLELRTAAPLGLLWRRRERELQARAMVYPEILPLTTCPIVDEMGSTPQPLYRSRDRNSIAASEGMTRSLRPYRWGDSTRMIHWRTSARTGNLQIRELETFTGGPEIVIALDSESRWSERAFEQAVIAAASLFYYASQRGYRVSLWTAGSGLIHGLTSTLETLAAIEAEEQPREIGLQPLQGSCLWLSNSWNSTSRLSNCSRAILWDDCSKSPQIPSAHSPLGNSALPIPQESMGVLGLVINPEQNLLSQLEAPSKR